MQEEPIPGPRARMGEGGAYVVHKSHMHLLSYTCIACTHCSTHTSHAPVVPHTRCPTHTSHAPVVQHVHYVFTFTYCSLFCSPPPHLLPVVLLSHKLAHPMPLPYPPHTSRLHTCCQLTCSLVRLLTLLSSRLCSCAIATTMHDTPRSTPSGVRERCRTTDRRDRAWRQRMPRARGSDLHA